MKSHMRRDAGDENGCICSWSSPLLGAGAVEGQVEVYMMGRLTVPLLEEVLRMGMWVGEVWSRVDV